MILDVRCDSCGGDVIRRDPDTDTFVVCGVVQCVACRAVPVCINCRRPFVEDNFRYHFIRASLSVGPFCTVCHQVIHSSEVINVERG